MLNLSRQVGYLHLSELSDAKLYNNLFFLLDVSSNRQYKSLVSLKVNLLCPITQSRYTEFSFDTFLPNPRQRYGIRETAHIVKRLMFVFVSE